MKNWNISITLAGVIISATLIFTSAKVPSVLQLGVCQGPHKPIGIQTDPYLKHFPSDAKMWTMYPKAAEIFSEKESMIGILGKESDLEEYLPILKLFAKEGKNLFSDVKIHAEYSVDGKEHVVNSQEEFYRNFKY